MGVGVGPGHSQAARVRHMTLGAHTRSALESPQRPQPWGVVVVTEEVQKDPGRYERVSRRCEAGGSTGSIEGCYQNMVDECRTQSMAWRGSNAS